jgi:glycosyltransferase involved in cell wall biosynthesis
VEQFINHKIAWLFPSLHDGNYWHPIISELKKSYPQVTVYTGLWPGFSPGYENAFEVRIVGNTRFIATSRLETAYKRSYIIPSPKIAGWLLSQRPNVIFTSAFSIWTMIALVLKPLGGWRVVIVFDGVSNGLDYLNSGSRIFLRRILARLTDVFITNNNLSKTYLKDTVGASEQRILIGPYLVPDPQALLYKPEIVGFNQLGFKKNIFLCVGQIVPRKGIQSLLTACSLLKERGYDQYTLLMVGEGAQKTEMEDFMRSHDLQDNVKWIGKVEYQQLGAYFEMADVFICPTLEDIWGMVILEAMVLGKPVLCSKWAGASEMVVDGSNGYVFDAHKPEQLANLMQKFIDNPALSQTMGAKSKELMAVHTPQTVAQFLTKAIELSLSNLKS